MGKFRLALCASSCRRSVSRRIHPRVSCGFPRCPSCRRPRPRHSPKRRYSSSKGGGAEGALAVYEELGHSTSPAVRAGALVRVARVHRRERRWNDALTAYRRLAEISGIAIYDIPVDLLARRAICQPRYPPDIAEKTEDQVAEDFLRDASAERWGTIGEIGSSMTMHPDERKVLRASCTVHLRTGLPLFTHTPHEGCRQCALEQLDIIDRWV